MHSAIEDHVVDAVRGDELPVQKKTVDRLAAIQRGERFESEVHAELKTGWFSDRTAAYLAMSRPVVIEDTGMPEWIKDSPGILTFRTMTDACDRLMECTGEYELHKRGAEDFAKYHLDSNRVLERMIDISLC